MNTRILYKTGSNITDFSTEVCSYESGSAEITMGASDAIYIGQRAPFNHLYFKMKKPNTTASVVSVKLWDGTDWNAVAELIDETTKLSKSFGQSGFITWTPDRDESGWAREHTEDISDLSTIKIYDMFWLKIEVDQAYTSSMKLEWVGHKFSNDDDLFYEYPMLAQSNMKTAFDASKTSWEDQHVRAAEIIEADLIRANVIHHSGQILIKSQLKLAAVHKVAEIVFRAFGDDYRQNATDAHNQYKSAINKKNFKVDLNGNADLDRTEDMIRTGWLKR